MVAALRSLQVNEAEVREVAHWLARGLASPDDTIRAETALALKHLGPEAVRGLLDALPLDHRIIGPVTQLVASMDLPEGLVPALAKELSRGDEDHRAEAALFLRVIGPRARETAPQVIQRLAHPRETLENCMAMAHALARMAPIDPGLTPAFQKAASALRARIAADDDGDWLGSDLDDALRLASMSIAPTDQDRRLASLLLDDDDEEARLRGVTMLAAAGGAGAVGLLIHTTTSDEDEDVRVAAVSGLFAIATGPTSTRELRLEILDTIIGARGREVPAKVAEAISIASCLIAGAPESGSRREADARAADAITEVSGDGVVRTCAAGLAVAVSDPSPQVRYRAVRVLGLLGPRASAHREVVQRATADADPDVAMAASEALVAVGGAPAPSAAPAAPTVPAPVPVGRDVREAP